MTGYVFSEIARVKKTRQPSIVVHKSYGDSRVDGQKTIVKFPVGFGMNNVVMGVYSLALSDLQAQQLIFA